MSLSSLTKEQKQYVLLGGIGLVIVAVLVFFGIKFAIDSSASAREAQEEVNGKIEKADRMLAKRGSKLAELDQVVLQLSAYLENAPPERNLYSWATEIIYALAREAKMDIDAIDEESVRGSETKEVPVGFEGYALRISANADYEGVKTFIERLGEEQPLARIVGLEINKSTDPDLHDVQLNVQWPVYVGERSGAWEELMQRHQEILANPGKASIQDGDASVAEDQVGSGTREKSEQSAEPLGEETETKVEGI